MSRMCQLFSLSNKICYPSGLPEFSEFLVLVRKNVRNETFLIRFPFFARLCAPKKKIRRVGQHWHQVYSDFFIFLGSFSAWIYLQYELLFTVSAIWFLRILPSHTRTNTCSWYKFKVTFPASGGNSGLTLKQNGLLEFISESKNYED